MGPVKNEDVPLQLCRIMPDVRYAGIDSPCGAMYSELWASVDGMTYAAKLWRVISLQRRPMKSNEVVVS